MTREEKERIQQKLHRAADVHLNAYGGNLYYEGVARGLEQAAGIVGKVRCEEEPQWIPCGERLPEEDGYYLMTNSKWGAPWREITLWVTDGWSSDNKPIAWMPLPKPYEERREVNADAKGKG